MKKAYKHLFSISVILIFILIFPLVSHAQNSPRRNFSVETRWGYYVMDSSQWKNSKYGREYAIIGGIKVNLELFRQILQIGIGTGYMREHEPNYFIYNIPVEASVNIRLKFSQNQFIVPYIGCGVDYSYFKERRRSILENKPTTIILHNNRKGYHMNAGFQFLLNRFESGSAKRFDEKFGVNATYLTLEARYSDLKNFDKLEEDETDVSGWFYYMGLLFEF